MTQPQIIEKQTIYSVIYKKLKIINPNVKENTLILTAGKDCELVQVRLCYSCTRSTVCFNKTSSDLRMAPRRTNAAAFYDVESIEIN